METSTYEPIGGPSIEAEKDPSKPKLNPIVKHGHQRMKTQMDASTSFVSTTQTDLEDGQELYDKKVDVRNTQIVMGVNVNPNFDGGYLGDPSKKKEGQDQGENGKLPYNHKSQKQRIKSRSRSSNMAESDNASEGQDSRDVESGSIRETMNQDAGQGQTEHDPDRRQRPNLKRDDSFAGLNFDIVTIGNKSRKSSKKDKKSKGQGWSK